MKSAVFSMFSIEFYNGEKKVWNHELIFYCGDLSNINLEKDWRFKTNKRRRNAKFLDLTNGTIKYN